MQEKKVILNKGVFKKKISKAEELRGTVDVISKRFDHQSVKHKSLNLPKLLRDDIRKFLRSRREKGFAVDEKILKQHIIQIKRRLLREHNLLK